MKTIIKSLALVALFSTIGFSAKAQLGATNSTGAVARILKQITLASDTVRFGTISAGGGQTYIDPTDPSASTNVGFTMVVGRLRINATAEEPIRVQFDTTVTMRKSAPNPDSLTYRPLLSVKWGDLTATNANANGSVFVSSAAIANPATDSTGAGGTGAGPFALVTTQPASEAVTLFIGGRLHDYGTTNQVPATGRQTGTYRGTLNFEVQYNN